MKVLAVIIGLFVIGLLSNIPTSFSEDTAIIPIDEKTSLETTTTIMSVPENNTFPWGTVHGMISDPAERYTVTETGGATGIYEGTVFFTTTDESSGHRLRVTEDGIVTR